MAASSSGPKVSANVDEENGVVSIGVVHNGQFLPVASKSLAGVMALGLDAKGEPQDDDEGSEGKA